MIKKFLNSPFTLVGLIICCILVVLFYLPKTSKKSKLVFYNYALGRWEHLTPCEELPFLEEVKKAFDKHLGEVEKIKAMPGVVDFKPNLVKCISASNTFYFMKGEAEVDYKQGQPRGEVEKFLNSDKFFNMPMRGQKVK